MGNFLGKRPNNESHTHGNSQEEPIEFDNFDHAIWKVKKPRRNVVGQDPAWKEHVATQVRLLNWYEFGILIIGDVKQLSSPIEFMTDQEVQSHMRSSLLEFYQREVTAIDDKYDHWRFIFPAIQTCLSTSSLDLNSSLWKMVLKSLHRPLGSIIEYNFSIEIYQRDLFQTRLLLLENQIMEEQKEAIYFMSPFSNLKHSDVESNTSQHSSLPSKELSWTTSTDKYTIRWTRELRDPDVTALNGCMNLEDTIKVFREDPSVDSSVILALQATYEDAPWRIISQHRHYLIVFQLLWKSKAPSRRSTL